MAANDHDIWWSAADLDRFQTFPAMPDDAMSEQENPR
jgi:hypothetical protein